MICQYSIKEEQQRGESVEAIEKRLQDIKVRRQRQKMMIKGNKADNVKKQSDDDEEEETEDNKLLQSLKGNFESQKKVLGFLFDFMTQIFNKNPDTLPAIAEFPFLEDLVVNGMLLSENVELRVEICGKFAKIIKTLSSKPKSSQSETYAHIL